MNDIQILEPKKNNILANLSYSLNSTDASSNYMKKEIKQGNDVFSVSEFTSTYTKRTISKNISTSTSHLPSISNNDLFNMNQLYSNQKQLALPYNQTKIHNNQLTFNQNQNYLL